MRLSASFGQIEQLEQFFGAMFGLLGRNVIEIGHKAQKLARGEFVIQHRLVGHIAQDGLGRDGLLLDVEPAHEGRAGRRTQKAADHLDRRRLARAVGAEKAKDFAAAHIEVDVVHGDLVAKTFDEARLF